MSKTNNKRIQEELKRNIKNPHEEICFSGVDIERLSSTTLRLCVRSVVQMLSRGSDRVKELESQVKELGGKL
jgi:hypothetical protein